MILRHRLVILQSAFAVFAVIVSAATIYGVELHVQNAIQSLEQLVARSNDVERLRVDARGLLLELYEMAAGRREITASVRARRDAFFTRIAEVTEYAKQSTYRPLEDSLTYVSHALQEEGGKCLDLISQGRNDEALALIRDKIEPDLQVALETHLDSVQRLQKRTQPSSVERVLLASDRLLALTAVIGAACIIFVLAGAYLVRRWLLVPIRKLHHAAIEFAKGNLKHRIECQGDDELEMLGAAMNEMASSLSISQTKYRSLFENLRDAVMICDPSGRIIECRDSDTRLLSVGPTEIVGKQLGDVRSRWNVAEWDWDQNLARVTAKQERIDAVDVPWPTRDGRDAVVDVIAYPVEYGGDRYAAIVLRDVTERFRLQHLERRAETMEAAETFARGLAHDFKNLLNSAVMSLSLIKSESGNGQSTTRIQTALESCRQAARLSRRLLEFSCLDQGNPENIVIAELITIVLESVKDPFLASINVTTRLDPEIRVRMDRDHLTQVILNLIRNAREAMNENGSLRITTTSVVCADPVSHNAPTPFAVLTVADTGCGMPANVRQRLFEPLFSTKPRGSEGVRGMGLALVYAAVRQAGGFIQIDSEEDIGTTFRVHLPIADRPPDEPVVHDAASAKPNADEPLHPEPSRDPS